MYDTGMYLSYSIGVFMVVFLSGCIVNLLKEHFIYQLAGIAFFFTYSIIRLTGVLHDSSPDMTYKDIYFLILPAFAGISACLISMVAGFWLFPPIRRRFRG